MTRTRIALILIGVLILGLSVPVVATEFASGEGFKIARSGLFHDGTDYVESIDLVFEVRNGGVLSLGTTSGSVNVRTWSEEKVRLVITKRTPATDRIDAKRIFDLFRVQARHGGPDLSVTGSASSIECADRVGVSYTIWVPKSYNLDVETQKGDIAIDEVNGVFSVRTADGTIRMDSTSENLDVEVQDATVKPEQSGDELKGDNSDKAGRGQSGR